MGFKASKPHDSPPLGGHIDVYHVDERGKRDQPHHTDMKISYDANKPVVEDIKPGTGNNTLDLRK